MRRYAYNHDPSNRAADADPERMNINQTGLSAASAVGCFASGASPYGCEDMNGNVWEWTRSLWGEALREPTFVYPYDVVAERERLDAALRVARVLRGGGYFNDGRIVRCAFRLRAIPDSWDGDGGFRVVVRVCFS
jgi:iron(II)-dependent oxidoreductase